MNLGVQYYRPPFPLRHRWDDDFRRIRDSGLNTVQLWVLWSWVESRPGEFRYDDYDALMGLAEKNGLGVILSTIAEIQPYWIHRVVPDSEMITNLGAKVVSSNRGECHFGITPGGCTDHPEVWKRMSCFLAETVKRYRSSTSLRGWDAWNELRWNVNADGLVCYCPHTLRAYRNWLDKKYGGLDGLNRAWLRRYGDWDEVWPGKLPGRPYTELMAFAQFITTRANRHGQARYDLMKPLDPDHPITVHGEAPCAFMGGNPANTALYRGNDWHYADALDGVGCSSFPKWSNMDDADFGLRVEFVKSAAQGKRVWLSEVQGGRSAIGFNIYQPVDALSQQRWIWNGLACGADTILFWCWRDEVFGCESGGFGLIGRDGLAEERIRAMKNTASFIGAHAELINGYQPAKPEVGILFSPRSYYLYWAQEGSANRAVGAVTAYARGLVRRSIPCRVVEEDHLGALDELKILYLPYVTVTSPELEEALTRFVRNGGTIVCESECGAFSPEGFYRYPEERWLAKLTGVTEVGRRALAGPFTVDFGGRQLNLDGFQWLTPMTGKGTTLARHTDGALIMEAQAGQGRTILTGTYPGGAYRNAWNADFEEFLELTARYAGWQPEIEVLAPRPTKDAFLYVKSGLSGKQRIVFVFFPAGYKTARLRCRAQFFKSAVVHDLITGRDIKLKKTAYGGELNLKAPAMRVSVLVG